jgi:hypothetical protein
MGGSPIVWGSNEQPIIAKSAKAAEDIAALTQFLHFGGWKQETLARLLNRRSREDAPASHYPAYEKIVHLGIVLQDGSVLQLPLLEVAYSVW